MKKKHTIVKVYFKYVVFQKLSFVHHSFAYKYLCNNIQFKFYFGAHLQTLQ